MFLLVDGFGHWLSVTNFFDTVCLIDLTEALV